MGIRMHYDPGAFCWTGLVATDLDGASDFYSSLFGWNLRDESGEHGEAYAALINGRWITALTSRTETLSVGISAQWNLYVCVEDAAATSARVVELGGSVAVPPSGIATFARTASIIDPQGVTLRLFQPGELRGAELLNAAGALSWYELLSSDRETAATFYQSLFGWTTEPVEGGPIPHEVIMNGPDKYNGQFSPLLPSLNSSQWIPYFGTENIEASYARVVELGGSSLLSPLEITEGQVIAVVRDPQGAVFGLCQYEFEAFE